MPLSERLFSTIEKFIDDNYVEDSHISQRGRAIDSKWYRIWQYRVTRRNGSAILPAKGSKESRRTDGSTGRYFCRNAF